MSDAVPGDADGLSEWLALSDALLRGLIHTLNNRLTALSAYAQLAAMGDDDFTALRMLPAELARMQEVSALLRLLAGDDGPAEAIEIGPVLEDALSLMSHCAGPRAVQCTVSREGTLLPLRVPRTTLLRLLLVLVAAGQRAAADAGRDATVLRVIGDEQFVMLQVDSDAVPPYARAMARRCGATDELADEAILRLPNLLELRRRERASRSDQAG